MTSGQDPATWDYEVTTSDPYPDYELRRLLMRYLKALDANRMAEVYELRNQLRRKIAPML